MDYSGELPKSTFLAEHDVHKREPSSPAADDHVHMYHRIVLCALSDCLQRAHKCSLGPNSLFIRILLDKKYALPYKVVDALVFHFIRLANAPLSRTGEDKLPVLWHQSMLVFVQRCVTIHTSLLFSSTACFVLCLHTGVELGQTLMLSQIRIRLDPGPEGRAARRHPRETAPDDQRRDQEGDCQLC